MAIEGVIDVGRLPHYDNTVQSRVTVGRLVDLTLPGRYRLRTTVPARYAL